MAEGVQRPAKLPFEQAQGKMVIPDPKEIEISTGSPVCPTPQEMNLTEGRFAINAETRILVASGASARTRRTAEVLAEDLKEETGLALKVEEAKGGDTQPPKNSIFFHVVSEGNADLKGVGSQGYRLAIAPDGVQMAGRDEQGAFYATQTLLQLVSPTKTGGYDVPACVIRDWPSKPIRLVQATATVPSTGRIRGMARFKVTHYEVRERDVPTATANSGFARDRFVQLVPFINYISAWVSNPAEYVERPAGEDITKMQDGRRNACPSHPEMWKEYFARMDKTKEVFGDYVDISMDEMEHTNVGSRWNVCPRCRARNMTGQELMADTVAKIHAHLATIGKKPMVIDTSYFVQGISNPDDKANDWHKAAEILAAKGLAKDIPVYVWHFTDDNKLARRLKRLGFSVLNWSNASRPLKDPDLWDGAYLNMSDGPFRPQHIIGMVQETWSPGRMEQRTQDYAGLVQRGLNAFNRLSTGKSFPSLQAGARFESVNLQPVANRSFRDDVAWDGKGWVDLGPNYDLRALKSGKREFGGVPFEILDGGKACVMVNNRLFLNRNLPTRVEIPLGRKAASIVFLHTLDERLNQSYQGKRELAGYYFMVYEDGTYEPMELKYATNIANFDGLNTWWGYSPVGEAMEKASMAWKGQMGAGVDAVLYKAEWVNPYPGKKIEKIIFAAPWKPVGANPILVAATLVAPTKQDLDNPPQVNETWHIPGKVRRVEDLCSPKPMGTLINLEDGVSESDNRWRTRSGILVERIANGPPNDMVMGVESARPFWSSAASAVYDNAEFARAGRTMELKVTFPEPRPLVGVRFIGSYRKEEYRSNLPPSVLNYKVEVSRDGATWLPMSFRDLYIPEEEGPKWVPLYGEKIRSVRITGMGISLIQLYEGQGKGFPEPIRRAHAKSAGWEGAGGLPETFAGRSDVLFVPNGIEVKSPSLNGARSVQFNLYQKAASHHRSILFRDADGTNTIILNLHDGKLYNYVTKPKQEQQLVCELPAGAWHDIKVIPGESGQFSLEVDGQRYLLARYKSGSNLSTVAFNAPGSDLYLDSFSAN